MSCWVAPTIAAELWGMSVKDVLNMIFHGRVESRNDGGFSFVRLAKYAPVGRHLPLTDRPPTYSAVTAEELAALSSPTLLQEVHTAASAEASVESESEMGPPPEDDHSDEPLADWRIARNATSRMRIPPKKR